MAKKRAKSKKCADCGHAFHKGRCKYCKCIC